MKFKADENVPVEVAVLLRQRGLDAVTILDETMSGFKDSAVAKVCRDEGRVLITLDLDFADVRNYPPGQFPGFVVLRPPTQARSAILSLVERLIPLFEREQVNGKLWIVDSKRVRVRD